MEIILYTTEPGELRTALDRLLFLLVQFFNIFSF